MGLYEEIGGAAAVDAAVDIFYRKVLKDQRISRFFTGVDMAKQAAKQKAFLTMAFGGPNNYTGLDMRKGHAHLVKAGPQRLPLRCGRGRPWRHVEGTEGAGPPDCESGRRCGNHPQRRSRQLTATRMPRVVFSRLVVRGRRAVGARLPDGPRACGPQFLSRRRLPVMPHARRTGHHARQSADRIDPDDDHARSVSRLPMFPNA